MWLNAASDDVRITSDGRVVFTDHMVPLKLTNQRAEQQKQSRRLFDSLFVLLIFDWLQASGATVANRDKVHQQAKTKAVLNADFTGCDFYKLQETLGDVPAGKEAFGWWKAGRCLKLS